MIKKLKTYIQQKKTTNNIIHKTVANDLDLEQVSRKLNQPSATININILPTPLV